MDRHGRRVRLRLTGAAGRRAARVVRRPRRHLPRRLLRLLALARRADRRRRRRRDRLRGLGRPRSGPGVLRPRAVPDRGRRRRLLLAGSPALLRLLRDDADPDLHPRRRLGWPEACVRHDHVRDLHDGRLAADAGLDRRLRALTGHVQPDRLRHEPNDWVFLGFLIAFAVKAPLLPFHGWLRTAYTEAPPEIAALLSGVVSKAAVYGLLWIVLRHFPEPVDDWRTVVLVLAAAGLVYGSLLAFRQPDVRGRDRVLVDGADEPDRARDLRRQRPRGQRRRFSTPSATASSRRRCSSSRRC